LGRVTASSRFKAILPILEQCYGSREGFKPRPPVQRALITSLLKNGKERAAETALRRIENEFVDLNEMRVANPAELDAALGKSYPPGVGQLLCDTLTAIFNYSQSMDLSPILALDAAKAETVLRRLEHMPSRVAGELLLANFESNQLPATHGILRVSKRLQLVQPGPMESQVRSLRRLVPSNLTVRAYHALEMLAERVCTPKDFDCQHCPVREHCPTGKEMLEKLAAQQEKERQAQEAEDARNQEKRNQDRREQAEQRAATARLKKQIAVRSKKLDIDTVKPKKARKNKPKSPAPSEGTQMKQTPSSEVKRSGARTASKKKTARRKTSSSSSTGGAPAKARKRRPPSAKKSQGPKGS
jgi:endonuclease III